MRPTDSQLKTRGGVCFIRKIYTAFNISGRGAGSGFSARKRKARRSYCKDSVQVVVELPDDILHSSLVINFCLVTAALTVIFVNIFFCRSENSTISESMAPTHPTCKTVASRAMAFKLIAALCKPNTKMGSSGGDRGQAVETAAGSFDPSQNLQLLLDEGLEPLRKLLPKPDVWGYRYGFFLFLYFCSAFLIFVHFRGLR